MPKVPDRSKLIPAKKIVHGKSKTYQAIRYINPEERKKRAKKFLEYRKKASAYSRYIEKNPLDTTILYPDELKRDLPKAKNGEQYYHGHPDFKDAKKVSVNVKDILFTIEFKTPVNGTVAMIRTTRPSWVRQYMNEKVAKNKKTKFKRVKNVGINLSAYREKTAKLQQSKDLTRKQLGAVLQLLDELEMRIGGSPGGVKEQRVKTENLKPKMVVVRELTDTPQLVVKTKDRGLMLRNMKTGEDHPIPEKAKEFIRLGHYGATTLEARHVKVEGGKVFVDVIGKSGVWQQFEIKDKKLASIIAELHKGRKPLDRIFPSIKRSHVTRILDKYKIRPHDFRSYHATKAFVEEQVNFPTPTTKKELKEVRKAILTKISMKLWNQPGMVLNSYLDPTVEEAWRVGLLKKIEKKVEKALLVITERPLDDLNRGVEVISMDEAFTSFKQGWA